MLKELKTLIVIAGPTAVGKSALAIILAKHFNTDIISADSRQFYRELEIGTAKPDADQLREVRHHFINSHSITDDYDAAQFGNDALELINQLFREKEFVMLCGGSGLYIKAVIEGFDEIPEIPDAVRQSLIDAYRVHGLEWLQQKLLALDGPLYHTIDRNNPHRLIRALEVKLGTGMSISAFRKEKKLKHDFNIVKVGLELPREQLYSRIDARMDQMIDAGLFAEAERLYDFREHNALQTVGYREIFRYLEGAYDREEAIRLMKRNSRRYAKRQLTWFKRDPAIKWFSPDQVGDIIEYVTQSSR